MYISRSVARLAGAAVISLCFDVSSADAQSAESAQAGPQHAAHDMGSMAREGSGTSWLPDASPIYALHQQKGAWMLMEHGNAFLQYLNESGDRGSQQGGSINWIMGMARRNVGVGSLTLRTMFSFEPWTVRGCGYPDLLASGELCNGDRIHDRQHPHDLLMELAGEYDAPVSRGVRLQLYGGPAGEPALGPVAFPHRISALPNPFAPVAHHWLDSTHIAFGVVTGGLYGNRWKAEASAFNGREPDEDRMDLDFGPLDSVSGRVWFLPTPNFAFQVSTGRLNDAEAGEDGGPRTDITKTTASGTYHRLFRENGVWATTLAWGRNGEIDHATNAVLVETNLTLADRDTWFGRFEIGRKTAHDLDITAESEMFTVSKVQAGFSKYLNTMGGLRPGLGLMGSVAIVPQELQAVYGRRVNLGVGVFATLRPAALAGVATGGASSGSTMVMVQTALDPSKLVCSPPIDPARAARGAYQGTTYYFCSAKERDEFLTDPAMSLSMMPPRQ